MRTLWLQVSVFALALFITVWTSNAQRLRQEFADPVKTGEIKEYLLSGDAGKVYRALATKDALIPEAAMEPLWKFLCEAEATAFSVRDGTVRGYHLVDTLPSVRRALAGYGIAVHELLDQGFESDNIRKRMEACRVSGLLTGGGKPILHRLIAASEDNHGLVRVAALKALPVHGEDSIDPLFRRLGQCSDWRRDGSFSIEEIAAICSSLIVLNDHAHDILPRLTPYLDRNRAPDSIITQLAVAAKRLSYSDEPKTAELVLPAFERLKAQGLLASDANELQERYEFRKKIKQGDGGQSTIRPESK